MENTENQVVGTVWRVQSARFSVFFSQPGTIGSEHFEKFFGFEPEKSPSDSNKYFGDYHGIKGGVVFRMSVEPIKADFVLDPMPTQGALHTHPLIPEGISLKELLIKPAKALVAEIEGVTRLAFGFRFISTQDSREEAYAKIESLLLYSKLDPAVSSDFLYRINRPRTVHFSGENIKINRLGSWCSVQTRFQKIVNGVVEEENKGDNAALVETDVNSGFEHDLSGLAVPERIKLIDILYENSIELAEKGECP